MSLTTSLAGDMGFYEWWDKLHREGKGYDPDPAVVEREKWISITAILVFIILVLLALLRQG